jgi:hypothetical protein
MLVCLHPSWPKLSTMSSLSHPIPSCRHYLLTWLLRIERALTGCLQGCAVTTLLFDECNKLVLVHDLWLAYADDMVHFPMTFLRTSGSALPATISTDVVHMMRPTDDVFMQPSLNSISGVGSEGSVSDGRIFQRSGS